MSSTRTAKDDSVLHECRYASAPEYERGLNARAVAMRVALLDARADRELVWFAHYLSHQPGGLAAVANDLLAQSSDRMGTTSMLAAGKSSSQNFTAVEIREIRLELPGQFRGRFPLKSETRKELRELSGKAGRLYDAAEIARSLNRARDNALGDAGVDSYYEMMTGEREERIRIEREESEQHPTAYPVATFRELCQKAAVQIVDQESQTSDMERELKKMCIDPAWRFTAGGPWYFSSLVGALREYQRQWIVGKSKVVITAVGQKVHETLEYTVEAGILSLLTGNASLGQTFAARQWCEAHPGQARFCEVPPSNDEASFYRAISRALGLGNYTNYKNVQIRERVEYVLQTGGICLVLNRAENLWPQKNLREAFPGRLAWLFEQIQKGASACMISGPQFFMQQRTCEKTGWNSPEFRKKINHLARLPDSLSVEDMTAIACVMLPEAAADIQEAIAIYAVGQERDLAALEAISKRAQFLAQRAGRADRTAQDIRDALKFVGGSDKLLRESFNSTKASSRLQPVAADTEPPASRRLVTEPENSAARITSPNRMNLETVMSMEEK
jgi:hypothetical protein